MTSFAALADRVERAEGPDRELDALIFAACKTVGVPGPQYPTLQAWADSALRHNWATDRFTASLDAAMTLVEADAFWRLGNDGEGPDVAAFKATVTSGEGPSLTFHDAVAATPALALVAACLRAREPRA